MKKRIIKNGFISDDDAVKVNNNRKKKSDKNQKKSSIEDKEPGIDLEKKERAIIKNAEEKAQIIINDGKKEADRIYEEQRKLGYKKGFEEGKSSAIKEVEQEKDEILKEANLIKENAQEKYKEILLSSEKDIINMVMKISSKLIYDKLHNEKDRILDIVKKTIEESTHKKTINLYVSSEDFNTVTNKREKLLYEIDGIETLEIFHDESLGIGSCRVETSCGTIESSLEDRIDGLKKAFKELVDAENGS
jgi:flagellar assembly protein FliH